MYTSLTPCFCCIFSRFSNVRQKVLKNQILKFTVPLSRVSDPGGFYPDPVLTLEKKPDLDTKYEEKKPDQGPTKF